jgi:Fe-S cluster assembly protein SufD
VNPEPGSIVADTLAPVFEALPETLRHQRAPLWARAIAGGLPGPKEERWRYTSLAKRLDESLRPAASEAAAPAIKPLDGARLLAFANGVADRIPERFLGTGIAHVIHDGPDVLNAALASGGLNLDLPAGTRQAPIHLRTWAGGAPGTSVHLRHHIRLADNAHAAVFWDDQCDDACGLLTQTLEIELGRNARLTLVRLQRHGDGSTALTRTHARLQRDARFHYTGYEAGRGLQRHDLVTELLASGAEVHLRGAFAPYGQGHADSFTVVEHAAPHTRSRLDFRGLAMDRARGIFNGRVHVHKDAQKTDSEQHLGTLLLSSKAQINAKPELEIYADDVKCAHGATAGQIDEDALHYMRSRGIPLATARALLIGGFVTRSLALPDWPEAEALLLGTLAEVLDHVDWSQA